MIYGICSDVIITVNPRQNLLSSVYVDINWQDRFIVILICRWSLLKDRKNFIVTRPQSPVIIYGILIGTYNTKPLEENKPRRLFFNSPSLKKKKVLTEKNQKGTYQGHIKRNIFPKNNHIKGNSSGNNLRNTFVPEHLIGCFREIFMKSSQWSFYISVRNFLKVEMVLKCTLAGYSWSGWSRFRRPNDQRASTVKFTITIMQQWYLWKMWKNIKWCKLQVTV